MNRLIPFLLALFVSGFALHGVAEDVDETPPKYIESATLIVSLTSKAGEPVRGMCSLPLARPALRNALR